MQYIKSKDGQTIYPYTIAQLKRDNPQVSFPSAITDQMLVQYNVYRVHMTTQPSTTLTSSYYLSKTPTQDSDGSWHVAWVEEQLPLIEAQRVVREKRTRDLALSDWTQMPDSPLSDEKKAEWATYRQALRDITADSDFPYSITWPTKP